MSKLHLAVDLGAGSGRVMLGGLGEDGLRLQEIHRFTYPPAERHGHLRWDVDHIWASIKVGLQAAPAAAKELGAEIASVGVDSWGVDYGLVDAAGALVEEPVCYRDPKRTALMAEVLERVPRDRMFAHTGIQFLPFNTVYQLYAHAKEGIPSDAATLLMMPDLFHARLADTAKGEYTNATTTQLLDPHTGQWDDDLFRSLGLPRELMPELAQPGDSLGVLRPALQAELGLPPLSVIAPATHDTGSAVAGTPLRAGWAYISSGTWSLVGVERPEALINPEVARASFTNEGGAFGTIRFLKNVMGLWILESCRREWTEKGLVSDYSALLQAAAAFDRPQGVVFPDAPRFFNPPSMRAAVRDALVESGQPAPEDPARLTRVILDSLALRYASVLASIERLTGASIPGVHVVGGGSLNEYLNQATADATGKPVLAGPVEATAVGNVLVQAIASGAAASLDEARNGLARRMDLREFGPRPAMGVSAPLGERYLALELEAAAPKP
jgi:rhamnulokinase